MTNSYEETGKRILSNNRTGKRKKRGRISNLESGNFSAKS
mgnify:FL=1|jgi:hypothetical protein